MCYKTLLECAFVHHIKAGKIVSGTSLRADSEESTSGRLSTGKSLLLFCRSSNSYYNVWRDIYNRSNIVRRIYISIYDYFNVRRRSDV